MKTVIKIFGRYVNFAGENPVDTDKRPLRFGDKILVIGPSRNIFRTYYLGVSKSGDSLMYLSAYKEHIDFTSRHYVIKYDWTSNTLDDSDLLILQKINKQVNEELGIDIYA